MQDARAAESDGVTKRPSASQLIKRIVGVGAIPTALSWMKNWYPIGPGTPFMEAGNARLSMKEMD